MDRGESTSGKRFKLNAVVKYQTEFLVRNISERCLPAFVCLIVFPFRVAIFGLGVWGIPFDREGGISARRLLVEESFFRRSKR